MGQQENSDNAGQDLVEVKFPEDGRSVTFTDLQGVERKGIYRKDRNGYQETTEVEVPAENEQIFPEEEVRSWEYQ